MSTSIQVTSAEGETITTESAFVAGKRHVDAARHDAEAIAYVGSQLGVNLSNKTATQLLETPLLVHKSLMTNGVVDLVRIYDEGIGDVFFGEDKPVQNYLEYVDICQQRQDRLQPLVESITDKLILEAPSIHTRTQAVERLGQLSQDYMVIQATFDEEINPLVFGAQAAAFIEEARSFAAQGDLERALLMAQRGQSVAVSTSCPGGVSRAEGADGDSGQSSSEEVGDCEFISKKCPKCGAKNVHTKVSKGTISGSCGCRAKLS